MKYFDTTSPASVADAASFLLLASLSFDPVDYGICTFLPLLETGTGTDEDSVPHFEE